MSLTNTFEFATWPCTDKYADDPKTLEPAYRKLLWPERVKGLNSIFHSVDQERMNGHGFLCWDSLQDHLNYIADKERQAPVAVHFADAIRSDGGGLIMEHAVLPMETMRHILEAPLTEVTKITFEDRASLEKSKHVVDKYVAYANRKETLPVAATFGQTIDLEGVEEMVIIIIIGWNSAKDQETFRKSHDEVEIVKDMRQVGAYKLDSVIISFNALLEE